ncbi:histone-lysine N-methyltransferase SUVR4 isoform X2 [Selaginella moellendorffii]|uniref:histone-lysine N-methyltransferase SUVR4 isoform X2 n=1 Tax=Selaginella moellendorffii TaxID=88036 RepID=UPI000D1C7E31|nr:histone-lysine N-methyltransferase SUVR4 isoform X2 [Selaginella moellendorffii]|eukprot:XP_024538885.1 histone-lysine N-methyltransferase SUVR4 isoform X2 [Selaginella moellendorffii]
MEEKKDAACSKMAELGFERSLVLDVLGRLLRVYEGSWTHIEENNFEVLVMELVDDGGNAVVETAGPSSSPSVKRKGLDEFLIPLGRNNEALEKSNKHVSACVKKLRLQCEADKKNSPRSAEPKSSGKLVKTVSSSKNTPAAARNLTLGVPSVPQALEVINTGESSVRYKKKQRHDPNDIAKGAESVPIPFVRAPGGDESLPEDFTYTAVAVAYEKAKIEIRLCKIEQDNCCTACFGNCLKKKWPCHCARETGGEFAYNEDGCVKKELLRQAVRETQGDEACRRVTCEKECPMEVARGSTEKCRGHIVRRFIKECWVKCTCHKKLCGNRIVQQGVRYKLEVFWTPTGKGWGVRTTEDLPMGAFVCEYIGEILTNTELDERNEERFLKQSRHFYPIYLDSDVCTERILEDDHLLCLDCTHYGNVARFINHRCGDANLIDIPVEIECPDRHFYHIALFTKHAVSAMEELTWDYQLDFADENHPIKAFRCKCGSRECKDTRE